MRNALPFALVLALAACGSPPAEQTAPVTNDIVANDAEPVTDTPVAQPTEASGEATPTPSPAPSASPMPEPTATATPDELSGTATIPAALRGRWGLVAADCTSTRGDAKGLLRIAADTIRFYESRAKLGRVVERDRSRIVADFDFEGEGQTWERRLTLDGQDGGKTLIRRDQGDDAMPGPLRYTRCETQ
ncbi:hypothetical protein [Allosphingosinicella indica]|uniref:Lipoprotein n=1 Tax=Allosphingosinicella indica TaxID=941907 RepID=A0A1X7H2E2_9SPHN|nr:hypothetical protein [Allosphingosinicella indica]SMF78619.1 hypothetical protein SAMN06295910_2728 [Allosphingosinicella indica]